MVMSDLSMVVQLLKGELKFVLMVFGVLFVVHIGMTIMRGLFADNSDYQACKNYTTYIIIMK